MTPRRHLNKLRWLTLTLVFAMLVLLPYFSLYQNYVAAHAYDILAPAEKQVYDAMDWLTSPFVHDPQQQLDAIKGTTWSGTFFSLQLSDPLAVVGQIAAFLSLYSPFLLTALIPILFTLFLGRFYCGWICPATFLYELADKVRYLLIWAGIPLRQKRFDLRLKYLVLGVGIVVCAASGWVAFSAVYPPAILGREIYYRVVMGGFGAGAGFLFATLLFDLLVARRGFCRYLCPGGALYSILGRFRVVRIQRKVAECNDCGHCNHECQFGLSPMQDGFGQECNNCTACMAVCPTNTLVFALAVKDQPPQGMGHLSPTFRRHPDHDQGTAPTQG